jgi:NAD(P)-dependent dehydrogenase (short-subunit alcohol dehydrogenase family)
VNAPPIYRGRVVLITGGTRGIGFATALAFAQHGASLVLTYRWGTADEDDIRAQVRAAGAPDPLLVQADVAVADDTAVLMNTVKERFGRVDAFISNASVALVVNGLEDYTERGFLKSLRSSAWPTLAYLRALQGAFGVAPRYVVIMSSDGPDRFTPAYDFVAASKAAVETIARYLAYRLRDEGVRINVLRSRAIRTESFDSTFGAEFHRFLGEFVPESWFMSPDEVGRAAFALCSGMFDGVSGQVVMLDRGNTFADGISYIYERRRELGVE